MFSGAPACSRVQIKGSEALRAVSHSNELQANLGVCVCLCGGFGEEMSL